MISNYCHKTSQNTEVAEIIAFRCDINAKGKNGGLDSLENLLDDSTKDKLQIRDYGGGKEFFAAVSDFWLLANPDQGKYSTRYISRMLLNILIP